MDFKPLIPRDPVADGRADFQARADEPARRPRRRAAGAAASPTTRRRTSASSTSNASSCAAGTTSTAIEKMVEAKLGPLGERVYAIVNYDNFTILPELLDEYTAMVRRLMDRYYSGVSRYTTSGFLRMKLGDLLKSAASRRTSSRARRRRAGTGARRRSRAELLRSEGAGYLSRYGVPFATMAPACLPCGRARAARAAIELPPRTVSSKRSPRRS